VRQGHSTAVVAAGLDVLSPYVVAGFNSLRLVSARECRPFDRDRDGLNPGEGAAAFVLESAESAARHGARPLAVIEGFGEALDAYHHTRSHPEGAGLVTAMNKALRCSGLDAGSVDHVHLHGTGTQANDISEYHACRTVFGSRLADIPMCSTKSMTGHTFGGAGALSAGFCLLAFAGGVVPPTMFHEARDPAFDGLELSNRPAEGMRIRRALSIALGFGGEAFAVLLRKQE
jgi:3-oxoacyl-[acyl-carrier-protein] synthase II